MQGGFLLFHCSPFLFLFFAGCCFLNIKNGLLKMRKARFKGAEVMDKSDEGSIFEA
jgi:hypothetical protein